MDQVTLKPGDYVSTAGMTEEQYHAVAAAFMAAGADEGEYDEDDGPEHGWELFGWTEDGRLVFWDLPKSYGSDRRHLTIKEVLGAGDTPEEPVTDTTIATLRLARERLQDAQGAYQLALDAVRAELGEGFVLTEAGEDPEEDMSDPANWREGDLVECIDPEAESITFGGVYKIYGFDGDGDVILETDANKTTGWIKQMFKFHSRPN